MYLIRIRRLCAIAIFLPLVSGSLACDDTDAAERLTVFLSTGESFADPPVSGIEEGARITRQAQHAAVSEIRRNADTNWVATYVYQPISGYIGSDNVQLEVHTGSHGAGPGDIRRITIEFHIHE